VATAGVAGAAVADDEVAEVEVAELDTTEVEPMGTVLAGLSSARAFAAHSIANAPAKVAPFQASRSTRFIASFPTANTIVKELGCRVNSQ
jgi:hypothetical protein